MRYIVSVVLGLLIGILAVDAQTPQSSTSTAYVVNADNAEFYFHQNGTPTELGKLSIGTEIKVNSITGGRCYFSYNEKPAYIQRQLLIPKTEYLATQERIRMQAEEASKRALVATQERAREQANMTNAQQEESSQEEKSRQLKAKLLEKYHQESAKELAELEHKFAEQGLKIKAEVEATERFETSQKAKGLVKDGDQWVTLERFEATQKAKGLVKYDDRWMLPEEANKAMWLIEYHRQWLTPEELKRVQESENRFEAKERESLEADAQSQRAKGFVLFGGRWVSPDEQQQLRREKEEARQVQEKVQKWQREEQEEKERQRQAQQQEQEHQQQEAQQLQQAAQRDVAAHQCRRCRGQGVIYTAKVPVSIPGLGTTFADDEIPGPSDRYAWRKQQCPKCNGTGRLSAPVCSQCGGSGIIQENKYMAEVGGMVNVGSHTCPKCNGTGHE